MTDAERLEQDLAISCDGAHVEFFDHESSLAEKEDFENLADLRSIIDAVMASTTKQDTYEWTIRIWQGEDVAEYVFTPREEGKEVLLDLADGSGLSLSERYVRIVNEPVGVSDSAETRSQPFPSDDLFPSEDLLPGGAEVMVAVDVGVALLEPITQDEFGLVEELVGELFKAYGRDQISESDAEKIRELAELLREFGRDSVPGETERWKLVGAVRSVMRRFFRAPFRDTAAALIILEKLASVHWMRLVEELSGLMS